MDTTPPTSTVSSLPKTGTSLSFPVTVTGTDPDGRRRQHALGHRLVHDLRRDEWRAVAAVDDHRADRGRRNSAASATFTGQSNTTYTLLQHGHRCGRQRPGVPAASIEAATYLPDLTPPVTSVNPATGTNPSTVAPATGTFTLDLTGTAPGGKPLTYFEVFVGHRPGRQRQHPAGRHGDPGRLPRRQRRLPRDDHLPGAH